MDSRLERLEAVAEVLDDAAGGLWCEDDTARMLVTGRKLDGLVSDLSEILPSLRILAKERGKGSSLRASLAGALVGILLFCMAVLWTPLRGSVGRALLDAEIQEVQDLIEADLEQLEEMSRAR
ncbi:MAG: hypothetical protein AAF725_13625 [Acidobacteriota bacterium]